MKEIILTKGNIAFIDDEDFQSLSKWSWYTHNTYAARGTFINYTNKLHFMHRQILGLNDPNLFIDHIDGNGLNNQKYNLRVCTHSQNMMNRKKNQNASSRFKGVYWNSEKRKWHVRCVVNKEIYIVGYYKDEREAALAYNLTASFAHGEFANLNKI